jgi:hypothetical protein
LYRPAALTVKQQTSYTTDDAVSARETVFILSFELDKEVLILKVLASFDLRWGRYLLIAPILAG